MSGFAFYLGLMAFLGALALSPVLVVWLHAVAGQVRMLRRGDLHRDSPNVIGAARWWVFGSMYS